MFKRKNVIFYYNLTRCVMTFLSSFSFYILYETVKLANSPETSLLSYDLIPTMIETVIAGIILYLIFTIVFINLSRKSV